MNERDDMDPTPIPIAIVGLNFGRHIMKDLCNGPSRRWVEPNGVNLIRYT